MLELFPIQVLRVSQSSQITGELTSTWDGVSKFVGQDSLPLRKMSLAPFILMARRPSRSNGSISLIDLVKVSARILQGMCRALVVVVRVPLGPRGEG